MINFGVLIPTHEGQFPTLPECIQSCKELSPDIILLSQDYSRKVKVPKNIRKLVTGVIYQEVSGRSKHWIYHQKAGVNVFLDTGIDYVMTINGDCVITKPEGFPSLFQKFVDSGCDIMCCSNNRGFSPGLGTLWMLYNLDSMASIVFKMINDFNNWIKLSCEARLEDAVNKLGYKVFEVENPEHFDFKPEKNPNKKGTLITELGLVHKHNSV